MNKDQWMIKYKKLLKSKDNALTRVRNVNKKLAEMQNILKENGW